MTNSLVRTSILRRSLPCLIRVAMCTLLIPTLAYVSANARAAGGKPPPQLWLYYSTNLLVNKNIITLQHIWRNAYRDGYSHVLLTDSKFGHLQLLGAARQHYMHNVRRVATLARHLHLTLVPAICPIGYSNDLLAVSPALAEGVPVRRVPFVVQSQWASVVADPAADLPAHPTWMDSDIQLRRGIAVVHNPPGNARLLFKKTVHPYWAYHIRVWIKTRQFTGRPQIEVLAGPHHRELQYENIATKRLQPWRRYDVVFDALSYRHVNIYFGTWGKGRGLLAWRNWSMHVAGLVNPISRRGAPTTIRGYRTGVDFVPPRDSKLGCMPYPGQYTAWSQPLRIHFLTPVRNGTVVYVSWYYPPIVYDGEVAGAMESPRFLHLLSVETHAVRAMFHSRHYMLAVDELRALGWDTRRTEHDGTPGAILAHGVRYCRRLLRGDRIYIWGDMFDPGQNARPKYYLVNGSLEGSWRGLGRHTVVLNWDGDQKRQSLEFFAHRGNSQIIAAYYDAPLSHTLAWLAAARGVRGVLGVMYTTWRGDYRQMGAFAELVRKNWRQSK